MPMLLDTLRPLQLGRSHGAFMLVFERSEQHKNA